MIFVAEGLTDFVVPYLSLLSLSVNNENIRFYFRFVFLFINYTTLFRLTASNRFTGRITHSDVYKINSKKSVALLFIVATKIISLLKFFLKL